MGLLPNSILARPTPVPRQPPRAGRQPLGGVTRYRRHCFFSMLIDKQILEKLR